MDLSTLKTVSPNRHLFKKIAAILFSLVVIITSYIVLNKASKDANDVVEVLRIKPNDGIPALVVLTDEHLESYKLIRKEYSEEMILAEEKDQVLNKYTKYYLRKHSILHHDQLTDEKPIKNEWLYEVDEDNEVLTLPYNYLEVGGAILVPGDRIRIRVSYETDEEVPIDTANPNAIYTQTKRKVIKTEVLFESIVVKDMLNANSHSIYEVYKEVQKLSEDQRQAVMKSKEFMQSIQPRALLLEGSREQIDKFAKYKGFDGKTFLITILSRNNSNVILDQLPTLQKEVESWIENKK